MNVPRALVSALALPVVLALVLAVACVHVTAAGAATFRIGTEADDAPFESMGPDGKPFGFDIDLGHAICAHAGLDCVWVNMDFDGLIPALAAHRIDAALSEMTVTPARAKRVLFTDPITRTAAMIVVPAGSGITDVPATMKGKTVGVQSGTTHELYARTKLAPFATIQTYQSQIQAFQDLKAGRIDATVCDQGAAYDWLKTHSGDFVFAGSPIDDPAILGSGTAIALRLDDAALKTKLDHAIATVIADRTYATINAKYFPFSIAPQTVGSKTLGSKASGSKIGAGDAASGGPTK